MFESVNAANGERQRWAEEGYTRWNSAGQVVEQRPLNADEVATLAAQASSDQSAVNGTTLRDRAIQALATNRAYIGLATPTAAQNTAQVRALSRQVNALVRLALGQLDSVD